MATDGWAPIPNSLFREGWSKAEVLVYIALLCLPWGPGGMIRASQSQISAGAGVTDRTVRKVIPTLVERGAVRHGQPYEGVSAYYYVHEMPREEGFFRLPRTWLWDVPIGSSAKVVYLTLMAHRNKHTGAAFVSWVGIQQTARVGDRALGAALDELHRHGLIVRERQSRRGRREGVNLYHLPDPMRPRKKNGSTPEI